MRLFKCILLSSITLSSMVNAQEDFDVSSIIEASENNVKQQSLKEKIDTKNPGYVLSQKDMQTLKTPKRVQQSVFDKTEIGAQEDLWSALSKANAQPNSLTQKQKRYDGVEVFILVSLSMPKESLERLFVEASHQYEDKGVVFVFQGWQPPNFNSFINDVNNLMPDQSPPNVVVDPTIFKTLEVEQVPYFAINTQSKGWKKVLGDVTIYRALEESNSHYDTFTPIGKTFPISEPNILDHIYKKIEETDWNDQIAKATDKLISDKRSVVDLPEATVSYSYLVDGTITLNKEVNVNGKALVTPGEQVNPLSNMSLSKQYVIVDIVKPEHIALIRYLQQSHSNIQVITTSLPNYRGQHELEGEFGSIYQLDPMLTKRFGLEKVPSIVYQQNLQLKVDVFGKTFLNEALKEFINE